MKAEAFITYTDNKGYRSYRFIYGEKESDIAKELQSLEDYWIKGINNTVMIDKKAKAEYNTV